MDFETFIKSFTPGAFGIWTGIGMFAVYLYREWRETRKMSVDDRLARRDGYAKQVENLQRENRDLRADIAKFEQRHTEYREWCEKQHDLDRAMIRSMQDEITGMKRALASGQVSVMQSLPPNIVPEVIRDMANRTADYMREKDDKNEHS